MIISNDDFVKIPLAFQNQVKLYETKVCVMKMSLPLSPLPVSLPTHKLEIIIF